MHIPDGFLDPKTLAITDGIAVSLVVLGSKKFRKQFSPSLVAITGLATAWIFTVNIFAFPVAGGTSAHLTGTTLVAVLAGPWVSFFATLFALILQAFLFHHGGILSLGANLINIGATGSVAGWFTLLLRKNPVAGGILSFIAVMVGSVLCAVELWFSGRGILWRGVVAMGLGNLIPGILDGVVTFFAILFLAEKLEKWRIEIDGAQPG